MHHFLALMVVEWDAVELPSQFLENWAWKKEALDLFAKHYQTDEVFPDKLFKKVTAAKNFQSALFILKQLEYGLFDFRIHSELFNDINAEAIQAILNDVRTTTALLTIPSFNRFQHGFSHIFAGGYAAGYYSYLWAEVLSSDAFSRFEEEGIFNADVGKAFKEKILEKGGSEKALELFIDFRGREPSNEAFLKQRGL